MRLEMVKAKIPPKFDALTKAIIQQDGICSCVYFISDAVTGIIACCCILRNMDFWDNCLSIYIIYTNVTISRAQFVNERL